MKLLSQGAEAKIYLAKNLRKSAKSAANSPAQFIIKTRIPKSYRHPQLDNQIRTRRTKSESKILTKAIQAKINVPRILNQTTKRPNDQTTDKFQIHMEFVPGDKLSQTLNDYPEQKQITAMKKLGRQVAKLHANNIIHSDLTTSNIILSSSHRRKPISQAKADLTGESRSHSEAIYLIDFGLSYISIKIEDKAVDLHLLKQALQAKHFQNWKKFFQAFCQGYKWQDSKAILERLEIVEKRGRYKH
ncbi:Kae1-associated serine/threonine protein kinase [Candidatus Pacearchaeota archaeon]|nr:Kae1-associated serine/threonine protein kinase [Candidatus Pacearchaeota archaeon]